MNHNELFRYESALWPVAAVSGVGLENDEIGGKNVSL